MTIQADRLVVVIIDDLHIWKGRTDKTRQLATDVVTNLGAQSSMAVLFTSAEAAQRSRRLAASCLGRSRNDGAKATSTTASGLRLSRAGLHRS